MKKIARRVQMDVSGNYQRWQIFFEDGTSEIWSQNLQTGEYSNANGQKVNPETGEVIAPTGPTIPGQPGSGVTAPTSPTVSPTSPTSPTAPPDGAKTITRRVQMDVSGGYARWQIFFSDGTYQIWSQNLSNQEWSNEAGQRIDFETGNILDGTPQEPPTPEGKKETNRSMMDTVGGYQRWLITYDDGSQVYLWLNLETGQWTENNPNDGVPGGEDGGPTGPTIPDSKQGGGDDDDDGGATGPTGPVMAFDVFKDILTSLLGITDEALLKDIWTASAKYFNAGIDPFMIPDLLAGSADAPESYKKFLGDFTKVKNLDIGVTTIAEFTRARNEYKSLLRYYGLSEVATDENADKFMLNAVSVQEADARMRVAFNAVKYADEALKEQLKTYFPSLSDKDIVASILGVGETVAELEKKISVSGIRAESATAGLTGRLSAEELYSQGVTRQQARQGYQEVKATTPLAEAAAIRASEDASTIQTELEKESLLGLRSQRRARLAAREQAYFAGKSGTTQVSLGGTTSGAF